MHKAIRSLNHALSWQHVPINMILKQSTPDNQERKYLNQVIIDDVAQRIARQISSNRLPLAKQNTPAQPAQ